MAVTVTEKAGGYNPANVAITGGTIKVDDGSASAPSYAFASNSGTGLYAVSPGYSGVSSAGVTSAVFGAGGLGYHLNTKDGIGFSTDPRTIASDVMLMRDAANTMAQRNGVNAQAFNLYNTYTDGANYERLSITGTGITVQNTGTGLARSLALGTNNLVRWQIRGSEGYLEPAVDNAYDLGGSTNRVRSIYYGSGIAARTKAGAPVAAEIPDGQFAVIRDTVGLTTKLYYNNAGTLQSVALA
jgi:hypothetical protein